MTRLAEVKADLAACEKEREALWLVLGDVVTGNAAQGEPVRCSVNHEEVEEGARRVSGVIYRPRGAWPLLLLRRGDSVAIRPWEEWRNQVDKYDLTAQTLRERLTVAWRKVL